MSSQTSSRILMGSNEVHSRSVSIHLEVRTQDGFGFLTNIMRMPLVFRTTKKRKSNFPNEGSQTHPGHFETLKKGTNDSDFW